MLNLPLDEAQNSLIKSNPKKAQFEDIGPLQTQLGLTLQFGRFRLGLNGLAQEKPTWASQLRFCNSFFYQMGFPYYICSFLCTCPLILMQVQFSFVSDSLKKNVL